MTILGIIILMKFTMIFIGLLLDFRDYINQRFIKHQGFDINQYYVIKFSRENLDKNFKFYELYSYLIKVKYSYFMIRISTLCSQVFLYMIHFTVEVSEYVIFSFT